jgi:flavin-dependent dehydrogenase
MCALRSNDLAFSAEVAVLGGGPAGATAALRLARLGHDVLLIDRARPHKAHVAESLPASVLPMLDSLGLRGLVEASGFPQPAAPIVHWSPGQARPTEQDAGEPGLHVLRNRLDDLLLDAARTAGVQVLQARAGHPLASGQAWIVPLHGGGAVHATVVVDARGRRAWPAAGPRTVALCSMWRGSPVADARSRIEAGADAWYWALPLPDGRVAAAAFLDGSRCRGLDRAAREHLYRDVLAESRLLQGLLQGREAAAVRACDATARVTADAAPHPGLLQVGEAAFSIDPLSSQGVGVALRSALQAAACVHTALARPGDAALAWSFHRAQVRRVSQRHASLAAGHYAAAAQGCDTAFWVSRAGSAPLPASSASPPGRYWPEHDQRLTLDSRALWCSAPALEGDWVTAVQALQHPMLDGPIAFLAGHPATLWLDALNSHPTVHELLTAWRLRFGEARTRSVWPLLWQQGLIVPSPASRLIPA